MTKRKRIPHTIEKTNTILGMRLQAIREPADAFKKEKARLQADRTLSTQYRDELVDKARQKAQDDYRERVLDARIALKEYVDAVRGYEPSGADDPATIAKTAAASDRVRALLDKNVQPETIIARAADAGDRFMLDALRAEAHWLDGGKTPTGLDADRVGADPKGAPVDGLLARIDRARIPLLPGDDAGAAEAAMSLDRIEAGVKAKLDRAVSEFHAGPDLQGAVADRYAGLTSASGTDGLLEGGTSIAPVDAGGSEAA